MARISTGEVSNFQQSLETPLLSTQGQTVYWPPKKRDPNQFKLSRPVLPGEFEHYGEEEPSAGTSSSTSGSKHGKSGSSAPATGLSDPLPAQHAESHSGQDHPASQQTSSTAGTTGGSTPETGTSRQSRQSSSPGSGAAGDDTPGRSSKGSSKK